MNGYYRWIMVRAIIAIIGLVAIIVGVMYAKGENGNLAGLIAVLLGLYLVAKALFDLFAIKHHGTMIGQIIPDNFDEYDWSIPNTFYCDYGPILIPPGTIFKGSHVKIYWKKGMGARVLTLDEWFNY